MLLISFSSIYVVCGRNNVPSKLRSAANLLSIWKGRYRNLFECLEVKMFSLLFHEYDGPLKFL
jgi:hypothetical protein